MTAIGMILLWVGWLGQASGAAAIAGTSSAAVLINTQARAALLRPTARPQGHTVPASLHTCEVAESELTCYIVKLGMNAGVICTVNRH